jgi:Abortive infection C-terminus
VSNLDAELLAKVEAFKDVLIACAQGSRDEEIVYRRLRGELLKDTRIASQLPAFIRPCRTTQEFWDFITQGRSTYASRRSFLQEQFNPVLTMLEAGSLMPADASITRTLSIVDSEHVSVAWTKALERRNVDPEGAITAARTLVEATCKHILDETGISYDNTDDLPKLYFKTAEQLNLAPSQHTERAFRQILGACQTVVNELAGLRNRLSDAHGKGKLAVRPSPRHAELVVNLAGTMATFLITTWEASTQKADLQKSDLS